jgi:hypothetical protein
MAITTDVKKSLHITNTANDDDINGVIEACKIDLKVAGVTVITDTDALTVQAIKLYCRAYFNYQGEGERWQKAYNSLRDSMALCGDYNAAVTV